MGRVALFVFQKEQFMKNVFRILILCGAVASITPVRATMVSGIDVPEFQAVSGQKLRLNGAGLRTATVLHVKVYVAAFYSSTPLTTSEAVEANEGPYRFDFTFVRAFSKEKVEEAWRWQFKESGSYAYPRQDKEIELFATAFGAIQKLGTQTVEIVGDETRMYAGGTLRGVIKGKDFQKVFLSLWFGAKPVTPRLKEALLGKAV